MKKTKFFAALSLGLVLMSCAPKAEPQVDENGNPIETEDLTITSAEKDSVSYLVGIWLGNIIKGQGFGTDLNYSQLKKGMMDMFQAKGNPRDSQFVKQFKFDPNSMGTAFPAFIEKTRKILAQENLAKQEKFFQELDAKEGIKKTDSGIRYEVVTEGTGDYAAQKDTVMAYYKLTLQDGMVVDESPRTGDPVSFPVSPMGLIPGFVEALQLVKTGGTIIAYIPAELGYGERGNQMIDPNSLLQFEIEVTEIKPFVEPEPVKTDEPAKTVVKKK